MSVFSLDIDKSNPVTQVVLDDLCQTLGVTIKDEDKSDFQRLLAIFHESATEIMALPGRTPPMR
jgi:amidase